MHEFLVVEMLKGLQEDLAVEIVIGKITRQLLPSSPMEEGMHGWMIGFIRAGPLY